MKKNYYPNLLVALILVLSSCATGKKHFEKGDYKTAIEKAVKKLRSKPYNEKAKSALIDGYWLYSNQLDQEIADLKRTDIAFKWEGISAKYGLLNVTYDLIQGCPACKESVGYAKKYPKEYEEARQKAATDRFVAGENSLAEHTRLSAKEAYFHFKKTEAYNPNYEGLTSIMAEAKELATIRVVIDHVSEDEEKGSLFFNKVLEGILHDNRNQFVAFYENEISNPHQKLSISLDYMNISRPQLTKNKETLESDSIVVGTVEEDSVTKDVMEVVYADYYTFQKKIRAEGKGSIKITDLATGETLSVKSYPSEQKWSAIWAKFNGDKRALTEEQYELTNVSAPPNPSSAYFYDLVSEDLGKRLSRHIQNFYSNY